MHVHNEQENTNLIKMLHEESRAAFFCYSIKIFSKTLKKIKIFFDRLIEKMLNMHSEE